MEAIMLNSRVVVEGSGSNIFIIDKRMADYSPVYVGILEGITQYSYGPGTGNGFDSKGVAVYPS